MLLVEDGNGGGEKKGELRISWGAENNNEHWGNHWGREEVQYRKRIIVLKGAFHQYVSKLTTQEPALLSCFSRLECREMGWRSDSWNTGHGTRNQTAIYLTLL